MKHIYLLFIMTNLFHNLIAQPGLFNQPYQSYTPTFAGFSTAPVVEARYAVFDGLCHLWVTTAVHGVSNSTSATGTTFTLPFTSANTTSQRAPVDVIYSDGRKAAKGLCIIPANSNVATVYVDPGLGTAWEANGTQKSFNLTLAYEVTGTTGYTPWTPTFGGFSVAPTVTARSIVINSGGMCHVYMTASAHGTSNNSVASATTFTLPYTSASGVAQAVQGSGGTATTRQIVPFFISIAAGSNVATVYRDGTLTTAWNATGNKSFEASFFYEITGSLYQTWTPTFYGFSTDPVVTARYYGIGKMIHCTITTTSHGTSDATAANSFWFTVPFISNNDFVQNTAGGRVRNNSGNQSVLTLATIFTDTDVGFIFRDATASTTWTGSGEKSVNTSFIYEAENRIGFETNDSPGVARPVIITAGQSNLGTGVTTVASSLEAEYKQTYNKVRFMEHGTDYSFAAVTFQSMTTRFRPLNYLDNRSYQTPDQNGTYSLQFYLYPEIQTLLNRNLYVVHHGEGNTGLAVHWKATATLGDNFRELVFKTKATKNKITDTDGLAPDFKFLLWVHGEYDARVEAYANAYETNLTDFINNFRSQTGLTTLPVIIVRLNTETITAPVNPCTFGATVQAAQDAVAGALTNVYVYDPDGATMHTDKIHYTVAGEHTITDGLLALIATNNLLD